MDIGYSSLKPIRASTEWNHWSIGLFPYIAGEEFLSSISKIRTLYISGFLGGGKTILAFYLAAYAWANGWVSRIVSNIPSPLAVLAEDIEDIRDSAVILDESWQFLSDRSEAVQYGAALRKLKVLLLMPSVFPPSQVLSAFSAQRFVNGYNFGVPIWGYRYFLSYKSFKDKGTFWFINPHLVSGWYDSDAYPAEDYGIARKLDNAVEELKIQTARKLRREIKKKRDEIQENKPPAPSFEISSLEGVAEKMEDASERIAKAIGRIKK